MSIFSDFKAAVDELGTVRVAMAASSPQLAAAAKLTSQGGFLARKLQAAEAKMARKLGVFLEPTEIFSVDEPTEDELGALEGKPWAVEPAYDLPPDFVSVQRFGFLHLLQRPLIAVRWVKFIHPTTNQLVFEVPQQWLKVDRKYAQVSMSPAGFAGSMPVSMFALQGLMAGVSMPHMIHVRYSAGLSPTHPLLPEVQNLVLRMAALLSLQDAFPGQSESVSADGLSQSFGQDLSKHEDAIDADVSGLRDAILGVMVGVL
jgi:hypothetical protein